MNVSSKTTGNDAISQMISRVVEKFDTDKDGKLSANEFGTFLSGLLGNGLTAATGTGQAARVSPEPAGKGEFRHMLAGFDFNKIEDPIHQTMKYKAARIFQNYSPTPDNMGAVIADLKTQGISATQLGMDKIDFNDGYGPIDVIQGAHAGGGIAWQWLPQNIV